MVLTTIKTGPLNPLIYLWLTITNQITVTNEPTNLSPWNSRWPSMAAPPQPSFYPLIITIKHQVITSRITSPAITIIDINQASINQHLNHQINHQIAHYKPTRLALWIINPPSTMTSTTIHHHESQLPTPTSSVVRQGGSSSSGGAGKQVFADFVEAQQGCVKTTQQWYIIIWFYRWL